VEVRLRACVCSKSMHRPAALFRLLHMAVYGKAVLNNFICTSYVLPAAAFARTKDPERVLGSDVVDDEVRTIFTLFQHVCRREWLCFPT